MASGTAKVLDETAALTRTMLEWHLDDRPCTTIDDLPLEMVEKIVQHRLLSFEDRLNIRCASKRLESNISSKMEFHPILDNGTVEHCRNFFNQSNIWKNYSELRVGKFTQTDCSWLKSCNLEQIESICFLEQIRKKALGSIRLLINSFPNLNKLVYKNYNFSHSHLRELIEAGVLDEIYPQISHLSIAGTLDSVISRQDLLPDDSLAAHLLGVPIAAFNCQDLINFKSLLSLELLLMDMTILQNISALPLSLKKLQLTTCAIHTSQLNLVLDRLRNLEKLLLHSCKFGSSSGCSYLESENVSPNVYVPLDRNLFDRVLHNTNIKVLHCFPILETTSKECLAKTSVKGSNIVEMKTFVLNNIFMVKIKRQKGFC